MILYAVMTHRSPADVATHLGALHTALPDQRFAVCYGGPREVFPRIDHTPKVYLDEPTLREPIGRQTYVSVLRDIHEQLVVPAPELTHIHMIEFDHVVVDERYARELERVLALTQADYVGHHCVDRTHTNWAHGLGFVDDHELRGLLSRLGGNADPTALRYLGGVANGFTISRRALEAFTRFDGHLDRYPELYVPTLLHYLGFRVRDAGRVSTIFDHCRYAPPYDQAELSAIAPGSALALHPVKDYGLLPLVRSLATR